MSKAPSKKVPELRFPEFTGAGGSSPGGTRLDNFGSARILRLNNACQASLFGAAQIGGLLFFRGLMSLNKTSKTYAIHCLRALILAQTVSVTKHMGCVEI